MGIVGPPIIEDIQQNFQIEDTLIDGWSNG